MLTKQSRQQWGQIHWHTIGWQSVIYASGNATNNLRKEKELSGYPRNRHKLVRKMAVQFCY